MVTIACRIDDVIVRKTLSADKALALFGQLQADVYCRWILVRHRQTGESVSWRAS